MAKEIERKFLVRDLSFRTSAVEEIHIVQGYLNTDPDRTVRVRIAGERAFITVKTRNCGCVRDEWEYPVPVADAGAMMAACVGVIDKTRYVVPAGDGLHWEIDCFHGAAAPLVLAEIELPSADTSFVLPSFIGEEVTGNPAYYNSAIATRV